MSWAGLFFDAELLVRTSSRFVRDESDWDECVGGSAIRLNYSARRALGSSEKSEGDKVIPQGN